jgi:hypothetical protein
LDRLKRRSEIEIQHIRQVSERHLAERLGPNEPHIVHDSIDMSPSHKFVHCRLSRLGVSEVHGNQFTGKCRIGVTRDADHMMSLCSKTV